MLEEAINTLQADYSLKASNTSARSGDCLGQGCSYPHKVVDKVVVPLLGMKDMQKELQQMEDSGIIENVTQPTAWCAPMVVVPKTSGVLICVDYTNSNGSVRQEIFHTLTFDQLMSQPQGGNFL